MDPNAKRVRLVPTLLWCAYAVVAVALGMGRTIEKVLDDSGGIQSRYGPAAGAIVVGIGVIGYALRAPIGWAWVWRIVFVLAILGCVGLLALDLNILLTSDAPLRIHAMILGGAALLVPAQIGLFRYAFQSPETWRRGARPRQLTR